jgi:predicted ATPase
MRIDNVFIQHFKNLKDFEMDLEQSEMNTILLGQNATGKSNFIEALILIFKYLDLGKKPPKNDFFEYKISYQCRGKRISAELDSQGYHFEVDGEKIPQTIFFKNKDYLPKYVFTYYSGLSNRLYQIFWEHQNLFYNKIIKKDFDPNSIDSLRRLFYVQQTHSYFVLLAFYAFAQEPQTTQKFLKKLFHIVDLESILFVLKKPDWGKAGKRFWGAEGLVKEFLEKLWEHSLVPLSDQESVKLTYRKSETRERLYLYISDKETFQTMVSDYFNALEMPHSHTSLFKALESTYISEILEEVRVKVKKEIDGEIIFKELSEGEQQLLTVLGLLKFTHDEESLIILDEPDTHLNPLWKWEYLELLNEVLNTGSDNQTTQILLNTHDPLVIGSLEREQVRMFKRDKDTGKIYTEEPDIDPKGLGVAGILTSELFGLPTTLDAETQKLLEERNEMLYREQMGDDLTSDENQRLKEIFQTLNTQGFTQVFKDPFYTDYLIACEKFKKEKNVSYIDKSAKENLASQILERYINT